MCSAARRQFTLDDVRHYRFPWMLRTTVDAYANGSAMQKARAALVDRAGACTGR